MNAERSFSGSMDDGDVVVTYSRVPARRRRVSAPVLDEPPLADAVEAAETVDLSFAPGELRAERPDFIHDGGRPGYLRYGLVGATLALIAGVAVLAVSVGTATMAPREYASREPARAFELSASGARDGSDAPSATVREIPLRSEPTTTSVPPADQSTAALAPPLPRPRPDRIADSGEQMAAVAAVPVLPPPERSAGGATEAITVPAAAPPAPQGSETDSLIANIEDTLARIDAGAASDAAEAESRAAEANAVAPPAPPPGTPPSVVMTPPSHPPAGSSRPLSDGADAGSGDLIPPADVLPPTVTGDTSAGTPIPPEPVRSAPVVDGAYPSVPIPPEAVPQAYQSDGYIYYSPGSAYPQDVYPPEVEARQPGLLRRSFAKASNAVGRVFWWN